jgi:uncharacterized protein (DUF169 family)
MVEYDWSVYDRKWLGYPPNKQGEILIRELELYGDPVALAWWPEKTMPPKLEKYIYRGPLKLVHCQFMQRARFKGETYILDGVKSRPDPPVCNGDAYMGLAPVFDNLMSGAGHTRPDPDSGAAARLGIYGTPAASRRNLIHDYKIVPPYIKYLGIAPLSDCPFDPDVVVIMGNPRQTTMACRALEYYSGLTPKSETGPGTCASSWSAALLLGEARYTLGCHGVFGTMAIDPNEICLSIPSEQVPALCQNLELWRERGKRMYQEAPPNEEREYMKAPYDAKYTKDEYKKPGYVPWDERLESPYESWTERRKKKGLYVPE